MAKTKEVHCKYCGKLFKQKYSTQEYCSNLCKDTNAAKLKQKYWIDKYYKNPKICKECGKVIPYESRKNIFCNKSCSTKYHNKRRVVSESQKIKTSQSMQVIYMEKNLYKKRVCKVCGAEYIKIKGNGSTNICCSKKCSEYIKIHKREFFSKTAIDNLRTNMVNNLIKMGGSKRSKNEVLFCELCEKHFTRVEHNTPIFNGWDADVIIHDIKYAILWNGVWHRKKITKQHSVEQAKIRDKIKVNEIKKYGYTPYIIEDDGSYNKKFVHEKFNEFIKYIDKN